MTDKFGAIFVFCRGWFIVHGCSHFSWHRIPDDGGELHKQRISLFSNIESTVAHQFQSTQNQGLGRNHQNGTKIQKPVPSRDLLYIPFMHKNNFLMKFIEPYPLLTTFFCSWAEGGSQRCPFGGCTWQGVLLWSPQNQKKAHTGPVCVTVEWEEGGWTCVSVCAFGTNWPSLSPRVLSERHQLHPTQEPLLRRRALWAFCSTMVAFLLLFFFW